MEKTITTAEMKNNIVVQIENCKKNLDSLLRQSADLNIHVNGLTSELAGLLAFGKQKENINSLQYVIELKKDELNSVQELITQTIMQLEKLGEERHNLHIQENKEKEKERKIREDIIKSISQQQIDIHQVFNQLEILKKQIEEGHPLSEIFQERNVFVIDKYVSPANKNIRVG